MLVIFSVFLVSLGFVLRQGLVITGMLKGPVLATFEKYGGNDPFYYPWPFFLAWLGLFMLTGGYVVRRYIEGTALVNILGISVLLVAWGMHYWRHDIQQFADRLRLPVLPTWYARLRRETSREERRRVAYMWLRLPLRTRLVYDANNRLFFQWAELVIMSSVSES